MKEEPKQESLSPEQLTALLREVAQRQSMMFHYIREIYEETRLPIKLVREVNEDEYLSRHGRRHRSLLNTGDVNGQAEPGRDNGPEADADLEKRLNEQAALLEGMGDPEKIPVVPDGFQVTCVRCGYAWVPRIAQPSLCAKCNSPWWYAPRWRWHRKLNVEATKPKRIRGRSIR